MISRINNDIAIADFEGNVHTLIRDVQQVYWDLAGAYHAYHAELTNRENVLGTWRLIKTKTNQGLEGGSAADESQSLETYFEAQGRTQEALSNLYTAEEQLRRLLGLPVNDGRVIRPCDEPTVAEFIPDWHIALAEGIARRPEIRKQKWNIKSLEYQLTAAKSLVRPRLDFVAGGQINAFGDRLISQQSDLADPGSSAFPPWRRRARQAGTSASRRRSPSVPVSPMCKSATPSCAWHVPGRDWPNRSSTFRTKLPKRSKRSIARIPPLRLPLIAGRLPPSAWKPTKRSTR